MQDRREWLITNGLGGYASGRVTGGPARTYHGLLVLPERPPLGRMLLVADLRETLAGVPVREEARPAGFRLEDGVPTWELSAGGRRLLKRVFMAHGTPTTYVLYELVEGDPAPLTVEVLANRRSHHHPTQRPPELRVEEVEYGVAVQSEAGRPCLVLARPARVRPGTGRWEEHFLAIEHERGLPAADRHLHAATVEADLRVGEPLTVVCSSERPALDGPEALTWHRARQRDLLSAAALPVGTPEWVRRLVGAADQFLVRRGGGWTVIAGYPWFEDWGRDTMIALPGLALATGRPEVAADILRTYAGFVRHGLLPNNFAEQESEPVYNAIDATLWYFEAVRATWEATGDHQLLAGLFPSLEEIVARHLSGTRFGVRVDPSDGLLAGGEPGVQLTWMDAKAGDWVVTPRIGKPVEVNVLWHQALRDMARFAARLGADPGPYRAAARRAAEGFGRFWNPATGYLYDVLDGPDGNDPALRPNQILAVSLPDSPLEPSRQAAVVEACGRSLLTPFGLRSLDPAHPDYRGRYEGDRRTRDGAYHQGTVWAWLAGPLALAHHRVHRHPRAALRLLEPMADHLDDFGVGSIAEIFDGDPPHTPRGCPWQAWSVAEILRAWLELEAACSGEDAARDRLGSPETETPT